MPSSHLILCCPLLLLPIPPSIRVFSNESTLPIRWPKYWSLSFSISPSKEHPRLISFRMDWLDLLAVQGTLKSLLQHHSSKTSILWHSAFFTVQLMCTLFLDIPFLKWYDIKLTILKYYKVDSIYLILYKRINKERKQRYLLTDIFITKYRGNTDDNYSPLFCNCSAPVMWLWWVFITTLFHFSFCIYFSLSRHLS